MLEIIKKCPLFTNICDEEINRLLECLRSVKKNYEKDEFIFSVGNKVESVGILLSGKVYIIREDFWGNRAIISDIEPAGMFGEAFSCAGIKKLPISVIAAEKSAIMFIDYRKIVASCGSSCIFHNQLIKNMLRIMAEKNILLNRKMEHLSKRTTREKLLSFLSERAIGNKSGIVKLPFNRQELADFLCVDRSALSREISLMQKEGLLRFDKNIFELLR